MLHSNYFVSFLINFEQDDKKAEAEKEAAEKEVKEKEKEPDSEIIQNPTRVIKPQVGGNLAICHHILKFKFNCKYYYSK